MAESKKTRVLYMEDDDGTAYLVSESLKLEGYEVETASNGEEGLIKHEQGNFDILLVDYNMPVVGGLEVLQILAAKGDPCPAVIITACGDEMSAVNSMKSGVSDYVVKDTNAQFIKLLPSVIEETLEKKRLIEEKEKAEKEVKESRRMLQSVLDAIPVAVFWKDRDSRYLGCNSLAAKNAGLNSPKEIIGKDDYMLEWRKHADLYREDDRQVIESGKPKLKYEEPLVWRDGKEFWVRTSKIPLKDVEGNITGVLGAYEDITLHKKAHQELQRHRHHLEELVDERTAELRRVQEQLIHVEKLSALGKLVGSVAHEFNNPLYGLGNIIRQIDEEADLTEEQKKLTTLGRKECARMAGLIRRLQDFYKPSAGVVSLWDTHKVIDEVILLTHESFKQKKITLEKKYCANLPKIEAVEDQIKQVFLNIIQNAQEAHPENRGTVTIFTEEIDSNIRVKIQDTGQGMSREQMKFIFDPFYSTKGIKGTGLGLAVSYGIIKKHGGDIAVESIPEKGSIFTITLPVKGAFR